jgi:hypothetical protein
MSVTENQPETEKKLSPEEIKLMRDNMIKYFKDQKAYLTAQVEHEELISRLSKARAERMMYDIRLAQMMAGPSEEELEDPEHDFPEENVPEEPVKRPSRKLKTEV